MVEHFNTHRLQRKRALTLIEMLVTISMVGVLLGLLAPSLMGARRSAWQAVCMSNMRQLQLASDLYADEHSGRYMPGASNFLENLHRWHGVRSSAGEPFNPDGGAITPYLAGSQMSRAVRVCPEFASTLDELVDAGAGFEAGAGGYGYNNDFVGAVLKQGPADSQIVQSDQMGAPRTRFERPAATIGFTDAALAIGRRDRAKLIEYSFARARFWPAYPAARPDPSIHFRHAGAANIAWLDGHVSSETMTRTHASAIGGADNARLNLGWFGERDDNSLFDDR